MGDNKDNINKAPSRSSQSFQISELDEIIKNLPEEYRQVMNQVIVVDVQNVKKDLKDQIFDAKKPELIEKLEEQINFVLSKSLKDKKYDLIKKDLLFYKTAYENEAANVNKIIVTINKLNHELYGPLKDIQNSLNNHLKQFKNNVENIKIPHEGINKGIESIKQNEINENKKQEFDENKKELDNSLDSYKEKAITFFKEYNNMNDELINSIKDFISFFNALKQNVTNLKQKIIEGYKIFENIQPEIENLDDKEKIRKLTERLLFPLNNITELISQSQAQLDQIEKKTNDGKDKDNKDLANTMIQICSELKTKANNIGDKINEIRMKVNLQNIEIPPLELKEPNVDKINENIEKMVDQLEETKKENQSIQNEVLERTINFINQSRLDILFIIDCTNSVNTYLDTIKTNFTSMIDEIRSKCPMATIYIGFIGYLDLIDLELTDEYINIGLTTEINEITDKIKNLKSHGGGDAAEDIAGAFDLALKKDWQGISRFAILAADAPCHGNEFHGKANIKNYDNYPEGDPNNRDIRELVRKFAEKNISLFCAKFSDDTDLMFDIFEKEYNKGKNGKAQCEFHMESCEDLCGRIIEQATQVYSVNRKENVENINIENISNK